MDVERAESRLRNIENVKPILAALRTISMSSWQMARNRRTSPQRYAQHLVELLPAVLLHHDAGSRRALGRRGAGPVPERGDGAESRRLVMVVGSERGLCGGYNKVLLEYLGTALREHYAGAVVEVMGLGSRIVRELRSAGYTLGWTGALSMTTVPSYASALARVTEWLQRYEDYEIGGVDTIHNSDRGAGTYAPVMTQLIPVELPVGAAGSVAGDLDEEDAQAWRDAQAWHNVIVETDVASLYGRIIEQWTANTYYRVLLDAASTEHAARYQLMESATQNADALSEELMLAVQSARRQAITREMQELAVGAGLLDG